MVWLITSVNTQTFPVTAGVLSAVMWTGPRGYTMSLITSSIAAPFCIPRSSYRLTHHPARMIYETRQLVPTRHPCLCRWNSDSSDVRTKQFRVGTHRYYRVPYTVRANSHSSVSEDVHSGIAWQMAFTAKHTVEAYIGHTDLPTSNPYRLRNLRKTNNELFCTLFLLPFT
jgi:hypothetical protein